MEFAIPGFVKRYCSPNAILTFLEYVEDYATPETRESGIKLIEREIAKLEDSKMKAEVEKRIQRIKKR